MKEFQYTVKDACGIHARPAGLLVKVAKGFASTAPWEDRISRLMAREGISRDYAEARLRAQHDSRYFQNLCDFTLENCGTKAAFYEKARALFAQLLAPRCPSPCESQTNYI